MASTERDNAGLEADIGITLGKLTRELASAEARMVKTAKKFETDFANANRKVSAGFDRTAKGAKGSADVMGREMDRLRAKYDPLFAASKQYEASLEELNRAHKVGALNTQQYERALETLNGEYARATGASRSLTGGLAGVETESGRMRSQIQNTAFQVGDFAVQVGAGTSASQALGQQLPQLLGGFGVMGAVLGAVVAAGVPLVRFLLDSGDAGETLEEKLKTLEQAVQDYGAAVDMALIPTDELVKKYGAATEAAQTFIQALVDINQVEALTAISEALDGIATQFGGFNEAIRSPLSMGGMRDSEFNETIQNVAEEFAVARGEAELLVAAMQRMSEAEGVKAQAEAAQELLDLMIATLGPVDQMSDGARAFANELAEAGIKASEVQGNIQRTNFSIQDMIAGLATAADNLGTMVGQAGALGDNMYRAATAAWSFLQARAREKMAYDTKVGGGRGADPRLFGGSAADIAKNDPGAQLAASEAAIADTKRKAAEKAAKAASRGSKGGKSKPETSMFDIGEKALQNLERQIEMIGKTRSEVAALTVKYRLLDEAKKRGIDVDAEQVASGQTVREQIDAQAEAVGRLSQKVEQYKERAALMDSVNQDLKDGFIDAIIEGNSFADVLANVAKQLAKAYLQAGLFNEGPLASKSGGGLLSGLFDTIFGGLGGSSAPKTSIRPPSKVPSLDGGGFTGRGARSGGIDGKGGFPAILHPNETVIDHTKGNLSGGGTSISFAPVINAPNADAGSVQRIEVIVAKMKAEMPSTIINTVRDAKKRNIQL